MRSKRVFAYSASIMAALLVCYILSATKPFAQPGGAPPPGMMGGGMPGGGMPGMPGGGGGSAGGGGTTWQWTEATMPDDLVMTYDEFLAEEGQAPVPLPELYLMGEDGTPKKCTRAEWYGLARVYADQTPTVAPKPVGNPGNALWSQVYEEAAVKHNEFNAIWRCWCAGLDSFWFEVGYPRIGPQMLRYDWERKAIHNPDGTIRWQRWEATLPESFTIVVPVVMHIKEKPRQSYGNLFLRTMKPYSNRGIGRAPFQFMTYEGGYLRPQTLYLADEAITAWNDLWGRLDVQLRLYDPKKVEIVHASQGSGLSPAILTQMIDVPVIRYEPRYRLLFSPEDQTFTGGKLGLDGKEGWYYEFQFTLNRDQLRAVNIAKARLAVAGGPPERMKFIGTPSLGSATAGGPQGQSAGPAGGMPGGPGAGAEGMGPPR